MDDALQDLHTAIRQVGSMLDSATPDDLAAASPCPEWTVGELADHLTGNVTRFAVAMRGGEVDWSSTPSGPDDRAVAFREASADLLAAYDEGGTQGNPDWQCAELATHTWDLATGLGRDTGDLDPGPAERGLAFMQASMKPEMRGDAFGPEQQAPEGADAYQRAAAFAGRSL